VVFSNAVIDKGMCTQHWWNGTDRGKKVFGDKPIPLPPRPPQIPHELAWESIWTTCSEPGD